MENGQDPGTAPRAQSDNSAPNNEIAWVLCIALATVVIHWITGTRYGFHRDELATLDDARHLAWGYVAYPPLTPFFARLSLTLFGTSLTGFRFFAAAAEAGAVVLTGLMARRLGGGKGAVLIASFAAVPFCLAGGALMQYVSFDYFFWVLAAYFVVRLRRSEDPRWWLAIGASIGFGMMTKYTMSFFALGIVGGVILTKTRRHFASKWLWLGVLVSILIFLPNILWQAQHHFISMDFLKFIHARDVRIGRTANFLPEQIKLTLLALLLALAGLLYLLFAEKGKPFRMLAWMYLIPLVLFVVAKGRAYYLAAAYPMLYAAGSVWVEQEITALKRSWAVAFRALIAIALTIDIALIGALTLPIAPVNSRWWHVASKVNGDLVEELGWPELVETVATVRDSLSPRERSQLGIFVGNYGEAGAINLYGPSYGLPAAISGVNSYWLRGYGNPPPETLIVVGVSARYLPEIFDSCQLVVHTWNRYGVKNEETEDHPDIYVCRGTKRPWPEMWSNLRHFG